MWFWNFGLADKTTVGWDGRMTGLNRDESANQNWIVTTLGDEMRRLKKGKLAVVKIGTL